MRSIINPTVANQTVVRGQRAGDVRIDMLRVIASQHTRFFTRAHALAGLKDHFKSLLTRGCRGSMCSCMSLSWLSWHPQQRYRLLPSVA